MLWKAQCKTSFTCSTAQIFNDELITSHINDSRIHKGNQVVLFFFFFFLLSSLIIAHSNAIVILVVSLQHFPTQNGPQSYLTLSRKVAVCLGLKITVKRQKSLQKIILKKEYRESNNTSNNLLSFLTPSTLKLPKALQKSCMQQYAAAEQERHLKRNMAICKRWTWCLLPSPLITFLFPSMTCTPPNLLSQSMFQGCYPIP